MTKEQRQEKIDNHVATVANKIADHMQTSLDTGHSWIAPFAKAINHLCYTYSNKKPVDATGMNFWTLLCAIVDNGYSCNEFLTYAEAKKLKTPVKKGEKGHAVVRYPHFKIEEQDKKGNTVEKMIPNFKFPIIYYVFNGDQCEGYKTQITVKALNKAQSIARADEFFANLNADIRHSNQSRAYYDTKQDYIHLPNKSLFHTTEGYYSTLAHETGHWTGHKSRCDRNMKGGAFSSDYAFEELVAELTSAIVTSHLGVGTVLSSTCSQHGSYLASWIKRIRDNPNAFQDATRLANKAYTYLVDCQSTQELKMVA